MAYYGQIVLVRTVTKLFQTTAPNQVVPAIKQLVTENPDVDFHDGNSVTFTTKNDNVSTAMLDQLGFQKTNVSGVYTTKPGYDCRIYSIASVDTDIVKY
jgi:hypothetical protein